MTLFGWFHSESCSRCTIPSGFCQGACGRLGSFLRLAVSSLRSTSFLGCSVASSGRGIPLSDNAPWAKEATATNIIVRTASAIRILFLRATNDLPSGDGLPPCLAALLPPQREIQISRLSARWHARRAPLAHEPSALYRPPRPSRPLGSSTSFGPSGVSTVDARVGSPTRCSGLRD
jgi:hypothetical protein